MRRLLSSILLTVVAAAPGAAGAACPGITDPAGDATVYDDAVLSGAYDAPVPSQALDLRSARAVVTKKGARFSIGVADLATLPAEAPTGASYGWTVTAGRRNLLFAAYTTPARSGVAVYAWPTGEPGAATLVADYAATVVDTATDTVRFTVPAKHLGWLRPGVRVTSSVDSQRVAGVHDGTRMVQQGAGADNAGDGGPRPWGRC